MRQASHTIFDEYVPASGLTYTSSDHNARLGAFDQIAFHVIVDNVSGTSTLNIFVEHSGDGRNFIQRNSMPEGSGASSATGDLSFSIVSGGSYQLMWADSCAGKTGAVSFAGAGSPVDTTNTPLLPFVRLRFVTAAGSGCHVKVHAVLRGPR